MNSEEIKKKKLESLRRRLSQNQLNNEEELAQAQLEQAHRKIVNKYLTKEAIERLGRVKLGHPQLAQQAELVVLQAVQTGQISLIGDKELKSILSELSSGKEEFRFIR